MRSAGPGCSRWARRTISPSESRSRPASPSPNKEIPGMAELQPLILVDPELTISGKSLKCLMSHVEITPDVSTIEIKTSCGTKEYPGTIKWTLKASLYHSFDPDGTNEVLTSAVTGGVPVPFVVIPSAAAVVSATNPAFTGELIPQP